MEPRTFWMRYTMRRAITCWPPCWKVKRRVRSFLLRGGVPLWPEHPAPCLSGRLSALRQITSSGVQELEGLRVFAERFGAAPRLVVCGGGHVGASVVRLARLLGLPVCALEDRPDFADDLRDAGAEEVLCAPFSESLAKISGGAECYFVVVTRAHNCDLECLTAILQKARRVCRYDGQPGPYRAGAPPIDRSRARPRAGGSAPRAHRPCHWGQDGGGDRAVHSGRDRPD